MTVEINKKDKKETYADDDYINEVQISETQVS